jgi:hypothetical protein
MHLSTRTFITVLLAAVAPDVTTAQRNEANPARIQTVTNSAPAATPIPPEVLAAQQSSAAAVASAVAAANSAAAASGLKPPPGLQADGSPASLQPLPALVPGAGDTAIAPPAVESSTPASSVVATVETPSEAVTAPSSSATLIQPPGFESTAPVSLAPLPSAPSLATSVCLDVLSLARCSGTLY